MNNLELETDFVIEYDFNNPPSASGFYDVSLEDGSFLERGDVVILHDDNRRVRARVRTLIAVVEPIK